MDSFNLIEKFGDRLGMMLERNPDGAYHFEIDGRAFDHGDARSIASASASRQAYRSAGSSENVRMSFTSDSGTGTSTPRSAAGNLEGHAPRKLHLKAIFF